MLAIGDVDLRLSQIENTTAWQALSSAFNSASNIVIVGHGGNLAVADHIAVDISRLTKQSKSTFSPGSAIAATSFINDGSFEDWMVSWFDSFSSSLDLSSTLVIGISSSGKSKDVMALLAHALPKGCSCGLISATNTDVPGSTILVNTQCNSYHQSEVVALSIGYKLIHDSGFICPSIN